MSDMTFGELLRVRRAELRISLRVFSEAAQMDPGNVSRLERGVSPAPEAPEVLARVAAALRLAPSTPAYESLMDAAAASKGRIPSDLLTDDAVAARLPVLFRTLRSKPLNADQLDRLIDSIRKA